MITPVGQTGFSQRSESPARGKIRIAETFTSRQGEGRLTGTESFFIRTSGCNLRCWFCDTPYASWRPKGNVIPLTALEQMAADSDLSHVVLTGGEPLVVPESVELCRMLRAMGMHVTIETAGTVFQPVECDLMSISPKFASSTPDSADHPRWSVLHEHRRMPIEMIRRLIDLAPAHQLKFVVDSPADYDELLGVVRQLRAEAVNVWVMPQGSTIEEMDAAAQWLEPWTRAQGFQYCDRMQIRWFGNRRGT